MNASPRLTAALTLAVLLVGTTQRADALATEQFGREPVGRSFDTFTADLLPVLNDPSRVYWYEVNGDAFFYYQGDTATLNALMKRLAAGGKGRELVLHAGPLEKTSLGGEKRVEASWNVHVPGGFGPKIYKEFGLVTDKMPTVHVYVTHPRPTKATAAQVAGWIKDLDNEDGETRKRAISALETQGHLVAPALREALKSESAEVRTRARALLDRLPRLNLDELVIPEGLTVVGPDDLTERYKKGLKSTEDVVRGMAATRLSEMEPDRKKAVAGLLEVMQKDKHEYVRRSVIMTLGREGKPAETALPALRELARDADVNVSNAAKGAIAMIEKAKEDPGAAERTRLVTAIRDDVRAFLKERAKR